MVRFNNTYFRFGCERSQWLHAATLTAVLSMVASVAVSGPPCTKCVNGKPPSCGTDGCHNLVDPIDIDGTTVRAEKETVYNVNYPKPTSSQYTANVVGLVKCADTEFYRIAGCVSKIDNMSSSTYTNGCDGTNPYGGESNCSQMYPGEP